MSTSNPYGIPSPLSNYWCILDTLRIALGAPMSPHFRLQWLLRYIDLFVVVLSPYKNSPSIPDTVLGDLGWILSWTLG